MKRTKNTMTGGSMERVDGRHEDENTEVRYMLKMIP